MVSLGANEHDLDFDFTVAASVASAFDSVATTLDNQGASRTSHENTASAFFKGYFAELFTSNMGVASDDRIEIASALRSVAQGVRDIAEAAQQENERRQTARDYITRHDDWWEKAWDWFVGQEAPPRMTVNPAPTITPPTPPAQTRETPAPGEGGGPNYGTSSAVPEDLRSAAAGLSGLNSDLSTKPGDLEGRLSDFAESCKYGTLNASGVIRSLRTWLSENDDDASWLNTVAGAFERAGSNGVVTVPNSALTASLESAGVRAVRTDLEVEPATISGIEPTTGYVTDPVNAATGNFVEPERDLVIGNVEFTRMYNSIGDHSSWFGTGWFSVLDECLTVDDEAAVWFRADGRQTRFPIERGQYGRGERANWWLEQVSLTFGDGTAAYALTDNAGHRRLFAADGRLLGFDYDSSSPVSYSYDSEGRVGAITDARGRGITVTYEGERVSQISATDGRTVEYSYDAGALVSAKSGLGTRRYEWVDGRIATVTSATGVVEVRNTYDAEGRVTSQTTPQGREIRFSYLPGRVTSTSDRDGTRADTWVSDVFGRLVRAVDSAGETQTMVYDKYGNVIARTSRSGATQTTLYTKRGLVSRHVNELGGEITYGWDDLDRLTTTVDPNGGVYSFAYVGDTRKLETVTDPRGGVTRNRWEGDLLREVIDPAGVSLTFTYDDNGDLVAMTDGLGNATRYERDESGYVVAEISPRGGRKTYTHTDAGLLATYTDAVGNTWRYTWSSSFLTEFQAPDGGVTRLEYDDAGQLVSATDPLGRVSRRTYDELGNVVDVELPDGAHVAYAYDSLSRVTGVVDADGHAWQMGYSPDGALESVTDPLGGRTRSTVDFRSRDSKLHMMSPEQVLTTQTMAFDTFGHVTSVSHDDDESVVVYDACGNVVERLLSDGALRRYERDLAGKVIAEVDPDGARTEYDYDVRGKIARVSFADGTWISYAYNADGQMSGWTRNDGSHETFEYDLAGKLVRRESSVRGVSTYEWNRNGKITYARDGWSGDRRYTYDLAGNLTSVRNGLGGTTRYSYDERNRLILTEFPDGRVETREYNGRNRATKLTVNGQTTHATYDALGRLESTTGPDGVTVTRTSTADGVSTSFDGKPGYSILASRDGREKTITDHILGETHRLVYDRRGRLISHETGGRTTSWTYTPAGRRATQTAPNGDVTTYDYDGAGRLISLTNSALGEVGFSYNDDGRLTSMSTPSAAHEWAYRGGGLVSHSRITADGIDTTTIDRDTAGRITAVTSGGVSTSYGYDDAGQLVSIVQPGGSQTFSYNDSGRLVRESGAEGTRDYAYNAFGQLEAIRQGEATTEFSYDLAGRRIAETRSDGLLVRYSWDQRGYLSSIERVTADATERTDVVVDALGNVTDVNGHPISWDVAQAIPRPIQEENEALASLPGGLLRADGEQVSWRSARPVAAANPWSLDDADGLVSAQGTIVLGGLELLGVRTYDSNTRAFLSTDVLSGLGDIPAGANSYSYANNNPLAFVDPWGMRPATDADLDAYEANMPGSKWEYVVGGLMVVGGVAATIALGPVAGAIVGGALISAGTSTIRQKWTTGSVDPRQVLFDGVIGAVSGLAGRAAGKAALSFASSRMSSALGARLVSYGADAFVSTGIDTTARALTTEGYTASNFGRDFATGFATSFVFSTVGGEISHRMDSVTTTPDTSQDIAVAESMSTTPGTDLVVRNQTSTELVLYTPPRDTVTLGEFNPMNPGPLRQDMADSFRSGSYSLELTTGTVDLYRDWGGTAGELGSYWSRTPSSGPLQGQLDSALLPSWGNTLENQTHIRVPAGEVIFEGLVAPQNITDSLGNTLGTLPGGGSQVVVPNVSPDWIVSD